MKKITTATGILSKINLILGALFCLVSLMGFFMMSNIAVLIPLLLTGAVVLHSYAGLQLRKSVLDPGFPMDTKTPTGIRFIGYLALLFAVVNISNAWIIMQNSAEVISQVQIPEEAKQINMEGFVEGAAVFIFLFSLSIVANVLLNLILLKRYMMESQK